MKLQASIILFIFGVDCAIDEYYPQLGYRVAFSELQFQESVQDGVKQPAIDNMVTSDVSRRSKTQPRQRFAQLRQRMFTRFHRSIRN